MLACVLAGLVMASTASAAPPGPNWVISAQSAPSYFAPGDSADQYVINVVDQGGERTDGSTIAISDQLPAGVTATAITGAVDEPVTGSNNFPLTCDLASLTCQTNLDPVVVDPLSDEISIQVVITVSVPANASGTLTDTASVAGGGGPTVSTTAQTPVSTGPVPFGISFLQTQVQDQSGNPASQAGGHPYALTTAIGFNVSSLSSAVNNIPEPQENAEPRDINVALPPGLVGNPGAVPQCSDVQFDTGPDPSVCPAETQVGYLALFFYAGGTAPQALPVYSVVPPPGQPAEFGFDVGGVHVPIFFHVRTEGDYGLTADLSGVTEADPVLASYLTLWGTPADPSHSLLRFTQGAGQPGTDLPGNPLPGGVPSDAPPLPLLDYPTNCESGARTASATADSWQDPGVFTSPTTSTLPAPTGCDNLSFQPSLTATPDNLTAGQPAGLQVDLHVPQTNDPGVPATPQLENATVTLPQGMVINPASAGGLQGCSDAQIALHSDAAATCPDGSQLGTVQVATPLLPGPLTGQVYLGAPECSPCASTDAQSGRMVRLYIVAQGFGVTVKLPGTVSVDPVTGQLATTFDQNPQLPFSDLLLTLDDGPRASLVNPRACGAYATTSDLSPWSSPFTADVFPSSSFAISNCGDPNVFAPTFSAGSTSSRAGAYSPFMLTFSRGDQDQFFSGLTATLPPGVSAKLAGVPLCSDSDASAGTCPAASRVGTATVASGPGSEPLWIPQPGAPQPSVYLTGPYKGAPYGLVVEAPAVAGPFNLGTVVVRQALYVDPTTAQVTAVSDPFPTILDGIPLQIRTVSVTIDGPSFTLNPTGCDPMAITGTLTSTGGMSAPVSTRFQVDSCQALGFSPKLAFRLTGRGQTHSGNHPTLTATLTQGPGQANIRSARVALPLSLALDVNNSQHVCNYDVAQAVHGGPVACPASTIVGQASASTPLLDRPLSGPVYLVQGIRFGRQGQRIHTLPSLLIPLRGQIALDLRASSAVNGAQQLVTTFSTVPDAPVSKFTLTINGGRKGILVITGRGKSICTAAQVADASFGAHSGKTMSAAITMSKPCAAAKHATRHVKRHNKRHGRKR
jgi:hypothetical protein